jgi:hypothetical protein
MEISEQVEDQFDDGGSCGAPMTLARKKATAIQRLAATYSSVRD